MIVTKTPFRITLGGGGTDLPAYANTFGGFVIAATINKYMYITINEPFDDLIRVKYSKLETVDDIDKLEHGLAREALRNTAVKEKIDIVSLADIPAGTGLGSSGAYLVGLLNALFTYKRWAAPKFTIAQTAYLIESKVLRHPVGYQDQFMAAFGGFTVLTNTGENITTRELKIDPYVVSELSRNLLMFYTFTQHDSNEILAKEKLQIESGMAVKYLDRIKEIGHEMENYLVAGYLDGVGYALDEHWKLKRSISDVMSTKKFDKIYSVAKSHGAYGGKITGSGGGGFFLFYVPNNHQEFIKVMEKQGLQHMTYRFEHEGSKVIVNL